jgi:zinc/manganese transport system ATP-binding protein
MSDPILAFEDLTLGYDRHPAVHHLDGSVGRGDLVAVVGPNGAGKSTLIKAVAGLMRPLAGTLVRGVEARRVAYLPQIAELDRSFPISVFDLVAMGLAREIGLFGAMPRRFEARVFDAIATVGLSGFERRGLDTLSGGQMQRALFARLILQDAELILLDEPFTAIDTRAVEDLLALVARWHGERRTVVAVLHDLDLVRAHFPRTLLIAREPVAFGPTATALAAENLLKARRLIESFDDDARHCARAA